MQDPVLTHFQTMQGTLFNLIKPQMSIENEGPPPPLILVFIEMEVGFQWLPLKLPEQFFFNRENLY